MPNLSWKSLKRASLLLLWFVSWGSIAGPLQYPKRSVGDYQVDLNPLFKWWVHRQGPRPLAAWTHLTGSIVGTNGGAWIIEARIEPREKPQATENSHKASDGPSRILLQNPPVEDLAQFEQLSGHLRDLTARRDELAGVESRAKSRSQAVAGQQHEHRHEPAESRVLAAERKQLKQAGDAARSEEKTLNQQIEQLKSKLPPGSDPQHYTLDCFALDRGYDYDQLAVYDYGRVTK